jgi:hypothetical protein
MENGLIASKANYKLTHVQSGKPLNLQCNILYINVEERRYKKDIFHEKH